MMAAAQVAFKSPLVPPFSKGDYDYGIRKPLFEKEGQGEIYLRDFSFRILGFGTKNPETTAL
jgi:hypothetical protein